MAIGTICATWTDGRWQDGNIPILGAADHATWLGTMVFDGARAFDGVTPDLDLHCERVVRSAATMGLDAPLDAGEIEALILDGVKRLATDKSALSAADDLVAGGLGGDDRSAS